jgi:hypothetical protein
MQLLKIETTAHGCVGMAHTVILMQLTRYTFPNTHDYTFDFQNQSP